MDRTDLAVIGAGPAGLTAARVGAVKGLAVTVLDENATAGGQVWRGGAGDGAEAFAAARKAGADFRFGATVWDVTAEGVIAWSDGERSHRLQAEAILIAAGSMERPVAFPGWTLPGVMGVGALQTAYKSGGIVPDGDWVMAGAGPLPLLVLAQLAGHGIKPKAYLDTTMRGGLGGALPALPGALAAAPDLLARGIGLLVARALSGVTVHRWVNGIEALGQDRVEAVVATVGTKTVRLETLLLAVHEGVVPQTAIARLLGVEHRWNELRRAFEPVVDGHGRVEGRMLWIAGDGAGIEGEGSAVLQGEIAAFDIAHALGRVDAATRDRRAGWLGKGRARQQKVRRFIDRRYPPTELARGLEDEVIVCRCERVTAGAIRAAIAEGATGPNRIKTFTRCGMGLCQGRMCGLLLSEIVAHETRRPMDEVGALRIRPPLKPIRLAELAALEP
jgi:NADPH-dependent 2,4-dienoyl-CoA reductase/sulfur reductase-like enzyme